MNRMEKFEQIWADQHAVPAESLVQYRWHTQEGYRLPDMAAHFRTFCQTLDSVVVKLPEPFDVGIASAHMVMGFDEVRSAIESSGGRVMA